MDEPSVWEDDGCTLKRGTELRSALSAGAPPSETRMWGHTFWEAETPLHIALGSGDLESAKELLTHGASLDANTLNGHTPLNYAKTGEAVELLLSFGADVNHLNDFGQSPLEVAIRIAQPVSVIESLVVGGADVNFTNDDDKSLLMEAALRHAKAVPVLLAAGADVNFTNDVGLTPLHKAARSNKADVVGVLLDHGADWRAVTVLGQTAEERAPADSTSRKILEAVRSKHELLEGLSTSWKPSDCKETVGTDQEEERLKRQRKM